MYRPLRHRPSRSPVKTPKPISSQRRICGQKTYVRSSYEYGGLLRKVKCAWWKWHFRLRPRRPIRWLLRRIAILLSIFGGGLAHGVRQLYERQFLDLMRATAFFQCASLPSSNASRYVQELERNEVVADIAASLSAKAFRPKSWPEAVGVQG
jgi:hypothetical protein